LSTQDTAYQAEAATRLHLPFPILSDEQLELTKSLRLPTFEAAGMTLLKRFTLLIADGQVKKVDYPIFPSHAAAKRALAMLDTLKDA
jgi:peroxiredoxin